MNRRHFTAWMVNDPSSLDKGQPNMDITVIEDELTGKEPHPFYAVTTVNAREGDAEDGIREAEELLSAAGWHVADNWRAVSNAYLATVERDEERGQR